MLPLNNELESCLYEKFTEHIKVILHLKFERKSIQGRYFMALWFFNNVVWFVLAAMLEGILLPLNMAAQTTFCLYLVKRVTVTLRCAVNVTTSSFQHSLKFNWKIWVQKEVIHNFKNHILVTWKATNLLIVRKWCGFQKPNYYYFVQDVTHSSFFEGKIICP